MRDVYYVREFTAGGVSHARVEEMSEVRQSPHTWKQSLIVQSVADWV